MFSGLLFGLVEKNVSGHVLRAPLGGRACFGNFFFFGTFGLLTVFARYFLDPVARHTLGVCVHSGMDTLAFS